MFGVILNDTQWISNCRHNFLSCYCRFIQQINCTLWIFLRFGHLLCRILQGINFCTYLTDKRFRNDKGITITVVEALCQISGQLHMLLLIQTYRYIIRIIQQDIRSHQRRIRKQSCGNTCFTLCGLILILCHSLQLAHIGIAGHYPSKLRMFMHIAL